MKLLTLGLLLAGTQAKALTTPAFCATAASYTAYTKAQTAQQAFRDAAIGIAATKCEAGAITDAVIKLAYQEKIEWAMAEKGGITAKRNPDNKTYFDNLSAVGAAAGIGNMSCARAADFPDTMITCKNRVRFKGPLEYQMKVFDMHDAYNVAMIAACSTVSDATAHTKCYTDGFAALVVLAKSWEVADLAGMTAAKRTEWLLADDKKRKLAAAAPAIAAGAVGFACKAAAIVAPAAVGVRPVCAAANCCMGHKKLAADTTNTGGEFCQLKTATKGSVTTTAATATITGSYLTSVAAVTASYDGACIEGAIRATSAALSVLATAYMMA